MENTVLLTEAARVFKDTGSGRALVCTKDVLPAGTAVTIGLAVYMDYDHREQIAVPFESVRETRYLLLDEGGIDPDEVPGIEALWLETHEKWKGETDCANKDFFRELARRS